MVCISLVGVPQRSPKILSASIYLLTLHVGSRGDTLGPLRACWQNMVRTLAPPNNPALILKGDVVRIAPNELVFMRPQAQTGT